MRAMPTVTIYPDCLPVADVRSILASYVRLKVQEKRWMIFSRQFLVTGPQAVIEAAQDEIARQAQEDWLSRHQNDRRQR
jgi:hypothetical protein